MPVRTISLFFLFAASLTGAADQPGKDTDTGARWTAMVMQAHARHHEGKFSEAVAAARGAVVIARKFGQQDI